MTIRGISLVWLLAALLLASGAALADSGYDMQAREVAPGVYAVITPARDFPNEENRGWNSNMAFVVAKDGVLVFDTGSSEAIGAALLQAIRGVTDLPVRWIVNSHSHGDHWLGNAAIAEKGTEIIASTITRDLIVEGGAEWVQRFDGMTGGATGDSRIVVPNSTVDAHTVRDFGGVRGEFFHSERSHSPGDIVLWLPEHGVLLAGDTVYEGRMAATFDADVRGWQEFLETLEPLEAKVVVPGHGEVATGLAVTRQREYFETLWALVEEGFDAGKADFEVATEVRERMTAFEADYPDLQENVGASVSHVYLQVEAAAF